MPFGTVYYTISRAYRAATQREGMQVVLTAKCKLLLFLDIITTNNSSGSLSRTTHIR